MNLELKKHVLSQYRYTAKNENIYFFQWPYIGPTMLTETVEESDPDEFVGIINNPDYDSFEWEDIFLN